ncbi:htpG [Acrasis kona]|uniref:HtpG n=1 Tax=Acrasis kona TaxID=1008807 RepID=A0AAW2Z798_9EUKA
MSSSEQIPADKEIERQEINATTSSLAKTPEEGGMTQFIKTVGGDVANIANELGQTAVESALSVRDAVTETFNPQPQLNTTTDQADK